jgi:hypothetical protein
MAGREHDRIKVAGLRDRGRRLAEVVAAAQRWLAAMRTGNEELVAERARQLAAAVDALDRGPGGAARCSILPPDQKGRGERC